MPGVFSMVGMASRISASVRASDAPGGQVGRHDHIALVLRGDEARGRGGDRATSVSAIRPA